MRNAHLGVTLIELIAVILIVGILTAIAVPSYRNYVIRANRADAKAALLSTAGALERCFTRFNSYTSPGCTVLPVDLPQATYRIEADAGNGDITETTFAIQAVPLGAQDRDTGCANFRLNSSNQRTVSGTHPPQDCWAR